MSWTYKHNSTLQIVEVDCSGRITASDLRELTSELIALQKVEGPKKFLVDSSAMQLAATIMDVYDLPAKQYQEEGADRRGRLALILSTSPKEREAGQFYEAVCQNWGWSVRAFQQRAEAIEWLLQGAAVEPDA